MTITLNKSQETRLAILDQAIRTASISSLNEITIGNLAISTGLSKSGLYAHFNSKENLQISILDRAAEQFVKLVVHPLLEITEPLQQLYALPDHWLAWYKSIGNNCIFISAAFEFDDQLGAVQSRIKHHLERWISFLTELVSSLIDARVFKPNTDPKHFVFELYSLYLGSQMFTWLTLENNQRFHFRKSFEQLINRQLSDQQS